MDLYKFSDVSKLGEGTFGTVFEGEEKSTGRAVAVKRAKHEVCTEEGIPVTVIREISMLKWLNRAGKHVVKLENHFFDEKDSSALLVFERHDYDLKKFAEEHSARYPGSTKNGGLKPDLIKVMTLWYRAPEILLGVEYNYQVDMWSIST